MKNVILTLTWVFTAWLSSGYNSAFAELHLAGNYVCESGTGTTLVEIQQQNIAGGVAWGIPSAYVYRIINATGSDPDCMRFYDQTFTFEAGSKEAKEGHGILSDDSLLVSLLRPEAKSEFDVMAESIYSMVPDGLQISSRYGRGVYRNLVCIRTYERPCQPQVPEFKAPAMPSGQKKARTTSQFNIFWQNSPPKGHSGLGWG